MRQHYLWVEKYRPETIDGFIGNDAIKAKFGKFILNGEIGNIFLSGKAGTGKTSLAKILINSLDCDSLYINASDENGVDVTRNKIKGFASTYSEKKLKIIVLDEFEMFTNPAQESLKVVMEQFSLHTRFILIANSVERTIDPIISRTQQFHIEPLQKKEVALHLVSILKKENVTYEVSDIKTIVDAFFPDIRKIINECQSQTKDGKFELDINQLMESDVKTKILEILISNEERKVKFKEIRQLVANNNIKDFGEIIRALYETVNQYANDHISQTIIELAEGDYRAKSSVDQEINFMSMIIKILQNI